MKKLLLLATFLFPVVAGADAGSGGGEFINGFIHPFLGLDHLLTALAVGVWAARSRDSVFFLPGAFLVGVAGGAILALRGQILPFYDYGVLLSLILMGLALFASVRLPIMIACLFMVAFGLFHGNVHGAALNSGDYFAPYIVGLFLATLALQATGALVTSWLDRWVSEESVEFLVRTLGFGCVVGSCYVWLAS